LRLWINREERGAKDDGIAKIDRSLWRDDGSGKVDNGDFWSLAENDLTRLVSGFKRDRLRALARMV